ncbi:MAG: hypothetical protein ACLUU0_11665 [Anaerostipes hadrus]
MKFVNKIIWGFGAGLMCILLAVTYGLNGYLLDHGYYVHLIISSLIASSIYFVTKLWFLGSAIFYTGCLIQALWLLYKKHTRRNMDVYIKQIAYVMAEETEGRCCDVFVKTDDEKHYYDCKQCHLHGFCQDKDAVKRFLKGRYKKW